MKLTIMEMLHTPTNTFCYGVVDEDDLSKRYDVYRTKEQAQCQIDLLTKTTSQPKKNSDS